MAGRAGGDELEAAERFAERRWQVVVLNTLAFAAFGFAWALRLAESGPGGALGDRAARGGGLWALWGLTVLAWTFGRGRLAWTARQRRVLNDELVTADQRAAATAGYWLLLTGLAALCGAGVTGAATPDVLLRLAVPGLVTLGVAGPALVFSVRQRRAADLADGAEHGGGPHG